VEDNEDVVDVNSWEDADHGCSVLSASTDWIELSDEHGLEKFEPSKNVEIIKFPGYDHQDDVSLDFQPETWQLIASYVLASGDITINIFADRSPISLPYRSDRPAMLTITRIV